MTTDNPADIAGFWAWFGSEADHLADVVQGLRAGNITETIDAALTRFGLPLTYEISATGSGPELIFTAAGDTEWARFLDDMVMMAPATRWTVHPQRPRRSLDHTLAIVHAVHGIDMRQAHFQARVHEGRFHLRFLDDGLFALPDGQRHEAAALFLDYALGERLATATVLGLDFQPAGDGIALPLMINELIRKAETLAEPSAAS